MKCPYCGSDENRVVDSRSAQKQSAIRRRRECLHCSHRFTTYEYIVEFPLVILKSDGSREEYDRQKLHKSIKIACNKRPISTEKIESVVREIEKEIEAIGSAEIESNQIGELVMIHLIQLDEVAYIRFASVYKRFQSLNEFKDQIDKISL